MTNMHHIAERMFNTPLMLDITKAQAIANTFAPRVLGSDVTINNLVQVADDAPQMGVVSNKLSGAYERWQESPLFVRDGVAIIEVEGSLAHKGRYIGKSSGVTSYEGIATQVEAAHNDASVLGVVFEHDSFGGEVAGAFDLSESIFELSQEKPTMAILTDHACSASYLLASACEAIVMPETGIVGSIGVVMMHVDYSKYLEQEGMAVSLLFDGSHKVDGNPYQALPDDVRSHLQEQLSMSRSIFAETVGRYRGSRMNASQALATEAQTYHGDEALDLGLIDSVARPGKAFEAFVNEVN